MSFLNRVIWNAWSRIAERTARSYIPGPALEDALRVCLWSSDQAIASTIGFWDGDQDIPSQVVEQYARGLEAIGEGGLNAYLSIKAPSFRYDPALLEKVLDRGGKLGVRVHFDSLEYDTADETFALIEKAAPGRTQIGCTLPGRWVRSLSDADFAARLQLHVRVVKGQWGDPTTPKIDVRANYLAIIDRLAGRVPCVAVATHDVWLARESLRRLVAAGAHCEAEMLYGLPVRPIIEAAREAGVPARMYVPYGEAYLPYTLSQARTRPQIFWWILRDALLGRTLFVPRSYARKERP